MNLTPSGKDVVKGDWREIHGLPRGCGAPKSRVIVLPVPWLVRFILIINLKHAHQLYFL